MLCVYEYVRVWIQPCRIASAILLPIPFFQSGVRSQGVRLSPGLIGQSLCTCSLVHTHSPTEPLFSTHLSLECSPTSPDLTFQCSAFTGLMARCSQRP